MCGEVSEPRAPRTQKPLAREERGLCGFDWVEPSIQVCPKCGHVAPDLGRAYPNLAEAKLARETFSELSQHSEVARRCLIAAALFSGASPREEGMWVLEAAWANEIDGRLGAARSLRLRAACLLEASLWTGRALVTSRGGSARVLAECFRVARRGDRAREHVARVIMGDIEREERVALLFELRAIEASDSSPHSWRDATNAIASTSVEERRALVRRALDGIVISTPTLAPAVVAPSSLVERERAVFASDYLEPELMVQLLRAGRGEAVASALAHRRDAARFLVTLDVWPEAVATFVRARFPQDHHGWATDNSSGTLAGSPTPPANLDPVLRRLTDSNVVVATNAALLLKALLPRLDPDSRARAVKEVEVALAGARDMSLLGALERFIVASRGP